MSTIVPLPPLEQALVDAEVPVKTCATCTYIRGQRLDTWKAKEWECFKTNSVIDPVSGLKSYSKCYDCRSTTDSCGPSGRWYEEYVQIARTETETKGEEVIFHVTDLEASRKAATAIIENRKKARAAQQGLSGIKAEEL